MTEKEFESYKKKFGENVKAIRERKGMSQRDVSYNCNIENGKISEIENGKHDLRMSTLIDLAKGLGVKINDLFDF